MRALDLQLKKMLIDHWQSIGVDADVAFITQIGYAELILGILIFLKPFRFLILLALGWKLFTEFLYVPADTVTGMGIVNIFEWIERMEFLGNAVHSFLPESKRYSLNTLLNKSIIFVRECSLFRVLPCSLEM